MPTVHLTEADHRTLMRHLFRGHVEQVAFGYADWQSTGSTGVFRVQALESIPASGFAFQSSYHIELTQETQARVIKTAFDRRACLVEFHSHRSTWPARFSGSDMGGFEEFVPHVRWRLDGRPYGAAVFHHTSFDGLVWTATTPVQLAGIQVEGKSILRPTERTLEEGYGF